jgi:hypothetical protein
VELDLARRDAACPELLLEPADRVAVGRAVLQRPRHEVEAQPRRAVGRALGPGQQHDRRPVDVRAEPLLAADLDPAVAQVAGRAVDRAAQVRAAVPLGQEHRAVDGVGDVGGPEPSQQALPHVRRGIGVHQAGDAAGHAQAAHHPRVGLGQQVARRPVNDARRGAAPLAGLGLEPRRVPRPPQRGLGVERRGVVGQGVDLVGPPVVAHQLGRVGVDRVRGPGDRAAHQGAEVVEHGLPERQILRRAVPPHARHQVGVEPEPVLPDHRVDLRPVDHPTSLAGIRGTRRGRGRTRPGGGCR